MNRQYCDLCIDGNATSNSVNILFHFWNAVSRANIDALGYTAKHGMKSMLRRSGCVRISEKMIREHAFIAEEELSKVAVFSTRRYLLTGMVNSFNGILKKSVAEVEYL